MKVVRRGIHTIEVQAALLAAIGMWLASAAQVVPPKYAVYVTMASTASIALSRGLSKMNAWQPGNLTDQGWLDLLNHEINRAAAGNTKDVKVLPLQVVPENQVTPASSGESQTGNSPSPGAATQ